jgi:hypothetical protein
VPVKYIGPLSRFERFSEAELERLRGEPEYAFCALVSGPEPQRSELGAQAREKMAQVENAGGKAILFRGLPPFPSAEETARALLRSQVIFSRSGYSTIMDLEVLGILRNPLQRVEFVPTPGQTEQEYLAKFFLDSASNANAHSFFDFQPSR